MLFVDFAAGPCLYRYGPDGKLIFKILKTGQGPDEIQYAPYFFFAGDRIRVEVWTPPKIMDLSLDGRYLREDKIEEDTHGLWFLTAAEGKICAIRDEVFSEEGCFVDSVVLRFPTGARNHSFVARWTLMTDEGFFIIPEQEEDGLISIGKYRIPDGQIFPFRHNPESPSKN